MAGASVLFADDYESYPIPDDPATLHVGYPGCANGCAGDPNKIPTTGSSGTADIYQNSGGAAIITNPMIVVAVPNLVGLPSSPALTATSLYGANINGQAASLSMGSFIGILNAAGTGCGTK